jgi:hypothetical protein
VKLTVVENLRRATMENSILGSRKLACDMMTGYAISIVISWETVTHIRGLLRLPSTTARTRPNLADAHIAKGPRFCQQGPSAEGDLAANMPSSDGSRTGLQGDNRRIWFQPGICHERSFGLREIQETFVVWDANGKGCLSELIGVGDTLTAARYMKMLDDH